MQENKKKKSSGMWIFLLILILVIGYFVYDAYFKDNAKHNQEIVNSEIQIGTVYEYTEEEIQEFLSKAEQQLEIDKMYGLEPGYDIDTWKKYGKEPEETSSFYLDAIITYYDSYYNLAEKDGMIYEGNKNEYDRLPSQIKYKVNKLKASDAFNDDLSLKIADAFYGYSSVGNPWFPIIRYNEEKGKEEAYIPSSAKDYIGGYQNNIMRFKPEIEALDRAYKNGDNALMEVMNTVNLTAAGYTPEECYGGCALFKNLYRNFTSTNSMNPLQTYLMGQYQWNDDVADGRINLIKDLTINSNDMLIDYFPDEYNYFADHDHYFFYYYPTRVEKIDERTYLVDIETTDVASRYAVEQIYYNICGNFIKRYRNQATGLTLYDEYFEKMDIIIRVNNTNMNKGMVLDYSMGSVLYPELSYPTDFFPENWVDDFHLRSSMKTSPAGIPWYPNEEAQELLEHYFTYAKKAYDNNSYFSFIESINSAAKEVGMDVEDAEKVVYSYYLLCNYIH